MAYHDEIKQRRENHQVTRISPSFLLRVPQGVRDALTGVGQRFAVHPDRGLSEDVAWIGLSDPRPAPMAMILRAGLDVHEDLPSLDYCLSLIDADGLQYIGEGEVKRTRVNWACMDRAESAKAAAESKGVTMARFVAGVALAITRSCKDTYVLLGSPEMSECSAMLADTARGYLAAPLLSAEFYRNGDTLSDAAHRAYWLDCRHIREGQEFAIRGDLFSRQGVTRARRVVGTVTEWREGRSTQPTRRPPTVMLETERGAYRLHAYDIEPANIYGGGE